MEMPHVGARAIRPGIRVLIADDDSTTREKWRALAEVVSDVVVVGACADGCEAVDAIRTLAVDLVFLAVEMPRLDGFGVLAEISGSTRAPVLIFTSASPEFAVRAFEAHALDYLLKPFGEARFFGAIERAKQHVSMRRILSTMPTAYDDVPHPFMLAPVGIPHRPSYHEAIAIRTGSQYDVVRVPDIDWIEANGNYSKLYMRQRSRILTKNLATLEKDVLDPSVFIRVHRSAIVNITRIASVEPNFHGELTLVLQSGAQVQCSRRYRHFLERRVYFTT